MNDILFNSYLRNIEANNNFFSLEDTFNDFKNTR